MPRGFENEKICDYRQAEEFTNRWIRLFESNPQTKHVVKPSPVFSHEESWTVKDYKLTVYYQEPYNIDDLFISWVKLTHNNSQNEEKILMQLDCPRNNKDGEMRFTVPRS